MEIEKVFAFLRDLPEEDFSEEKFGEKKFENDYNVVDAWNSKGKKLEIITGFTDNVDISSSTIDEVVLVGRFNRVDATEAKIKILNIQEADIIKLDLAEAEIGEVKGNK